MAHTSSSTLQRRYHPAIQVTLSVPVQATLYTSLCALILWTAFFSTYPPAHNAVHSLRHNTLMIGCH